MIKTVFTSSEKITNNRTPHSILAYLMEEAGELATEVNILTGHSEKGSGADGVVGEAIDVILCALDLIKKVQPDITKKDINRIVKKKCLKWEGKHVHSK